MNWMGRSLAAGIVAWTLVAVSPDGSWAGTRSARETPEPLGTFTVLTGVNPPCIPGYTCQAFKVTNCRNVSVRARGALATAQSVIAPKGLVMFFSGSGGEAWWSNGSGNSGATLARLRDEGFWTVEVRWQDPWLLSAPGEDSGAGHMACRPATVVKWVHDNVYLPLGLDPGPGECGFCITGNSGGSSQAAYSLAFYGLESIVDALIPSSGPGHAAQAKGCLREPGFEHYYYSDTEGISIDNSYGFDQSLGACSTHDPSWTARWNAESVDTGANDLVHPFTRVVLLEGATDCGDSLAHGTDYHNALIAAGSPYVSINVVKGMAHSIQDSLNGLAALESAILNLPITGLGQGCY